MFGQQIRSPRNRIIIGVVGTLVLLGLFAFTNLSVGVLLLLIGIHWLSVWSKDDFSTWVMKMRPALLSNRFWFGVLIVCTVLLLLTMALSALV